MPKLLTPATAGAASSGSGVRPLGMNTGKLGPGDLRIGLPQMQGGRDLAVPQHE